MPFQPQLSKTFDCGGRTVRIRYHIRKPEIMGKKKVLVSYGVDIDAVAGWLGSYGGEDSTSDISRGAFSRRVILTTKIDNE